MLYHRFWICRSDIAAAPWRGKQASQQVLLMAREMANDIMAVGRGRRCLSSLNIIHFWPAHTWTRLSRAISWRRLLSTTLASKLSFVSAWLTLRSMSTQQADCSIRPSKGPLFPFFSLCFFCEWEPFVFFGGDCVFHSISFSKPIPMTWKQRSSLAHCGEGGLDVLLSQEKTPAESQYGCGAVWSLRSQKLSSPALLAFAL